MALRRCSPLLCTLLLTCATLIVGVPKAVADTEIFDEAWAKVREKFYDPDLHGVDWEAVRDEYRPQAEAIEGADAEYDVIRRMLGELKASHTTIVSKTVYRDHFECEMNGRKVPQAGVELAQIDGKFFVLSVLEGSHADRAGVRKGDRVLRINGVKPLESGLLLDAGGDPGMPGPAHYFLDVPSDGQYAMALQSSRGESAREVSFEATRTNMVSASGKSVRVLESGDHRLGYIHLWHFLNNDIAGHFDRALAGPFRECDGLVLDIRGRGGNIWVAERVLARLRKRGSTFFRGGRWKKPVVLLIDENSRSAKEIFAWKFRKERLGPVVGRKTPGAVLGCNFFEMKDGSVLLLPVMDVPSLTDGVRLEGVGVEPTVHVTEPDLYSGGRDRILDEGVRQLVRKIQAQDPI